MTSSRFGLYPEALGPDAISRFTSHLAGVAEQVGPTIPVPTCGDWTMADLVWHLTEVQDFWAWILANRPSGPEQYTQPTRDNDRLIDNLRDANRRLQSELVSAAPSDPAWSWHPEHQSVDFSWRRQSHEALIHCFDAVLAAGTDHPEVSAELAADGIDELVTVMAGGVPAWADYQSLGSRLLVTAEDTGDQWNLEFGSLSGQSPRGTTYEDLATISVVGTDQPSGGGLSGLANDINLWAWGRGDLSRLKVAGDADLAPRWRSLVAESTQ